MDEDGECLPLHFDLSKTYNKDIQLEKLMVTAHPEALVIASDDDAKIRPIHTLLSNPSINELIDILQFLELFP